MSRFRNPYGKRKSGIRNVQRIRLSRVSAVYGASHRARCFCGDGREPGKPENAHRSCNGSGFLSA